MSETIKQAPHSFHIPVMGTAFTIDTPIKVARYGISSVISISDDELDETMREHYAALYNLPFEPIKKWSEDYRSRRVTAYLNLVDDIVNLQLEKLKATPFLPGTEITKYFELCPDNSPLKTLYNTMLNSEDATQKEALQTELRASVTPGYIDVNIMTKLDRSNYSRKGEPLPQEYSDALSALKGYADSTLKSRIIFSAGFNRRLYAHITNFDGFFPNEDGEVEKKVILKVSDYRSSLTQAKYFAKKGIWVDEHRIESGLNCGGHAFATDGYLIGPIMEEFKEKREPLFQEMFPICQAALEKAGKPTYPSDPEMRITVQGGIGNHHENQFLQEFYQMDGTGWATPFLLVPEVTVLDDQTRELLREAGEDDFFLSDYSPLGIPFNTVKGTQSDALKKEREKTKPGSPCPKGHLVSNTEFTKVPICTASRTYMRLKIKQLKEMLVSKEEYAEKYQKILNKSCLCEDLAASSLITNNIDNKRDIATAVCPGPNLAYFDKLASLKEMVGHIYGRFNVFSEKTVRPHMFIKELSMYIDYFKKELANALPEPTEKNRLYFEKFRQNLYEGIDYYRQLVPELVTETQKKKERFSADLNDIKSELEQILRDYSQSFPEFKAALA